MILDPLSGNGSVAPGGDIDAAVVGTVTLKGA
jgi:hypothetical protein